jgi:hypothetical protein
MEIMASQVKDLLKLKKKQSKNAVKTAKKSGEWGVKEGSTTYSGWNDEKKR